MATARSTNSSITGTEESEEDTMAWRAPINTLRPKSALSDRAKCSRFPNRWARDNETLSMKTASAASAPAAVAFPIMLSSRVNDLLFSAIIFFSDVVAGVLGPNQEQKKSQNVVKRVEVFSRLRERYHINIDRLV
jgi:hypothetical protein